MSKGEKAKELFESGMNCAQAVFCAFCDETGFDKETAIKLSAGFGGGMGRMREVCGAVSGMVMVLSYLSASADPSSHAEKAALYALIQQAADEFKAESGSIICRELLGLGNGASSPNPECRTKEYYKKRPCSESVRLAADIAEKYLKKHLEI